MVDIDSGVGAKVWCSSDGAGAKRSGADFRSEAHEALHFLSGHVTKFVHLESDVVRVRGGGVHLLHVGGVVDVDSNSLVDLSGAYWAFVETTTVVVVSTDILGVKTARGSVSIESFGCCQSSDCSNCEGVHHFLEV